MDHTRTVFISYNWFAAESLHSLEKKWRRRPWPQGRVVSRSRSTPFTLGDYMSAVNCRNKDFDEKQINNYLQPMDLKHYHIIES